ncbi:MAG: HDOD domain-containing protein [Leptospiraceae bacterium]|nr:HDOD domain-containing protein [Leptospiraceae bacterium]MCP5496059.1 HDOD domain-containing protein [Leptospiraceae bacterium]
MSYKKNKIVPLGVNRRTLEPYKVMIVDDSVSVRTVLKRLLIRKEFRIISEAPDGERALEDLNILSVKPDIICIDQEMPVMNGLTAIKQIKPQFPNIKIIMITNHSEKELVQEILKLQISGYILKPFEEQKIIEKLAQILNRTELLEKEVVAYKNTNINLKDIELPALPEVINKIMEIDLDKSDSGSKEIEKIVSPDISISANIIRIANSSYYGRSGRIRNLKDAITLLGVKMVKNLVLLEANKKMYKGLKAPIFKKYLREYPVLTAIISMDLAMNPAAKPELKDEVFLAGLLRKIGMVIFALNFREQYIQVLRLREFGLKTVYQIEKDEFNLDSVQLGIKVFGTWKMPDYLLKVISNQNFPRSEIKNQTDIDRITRLAEILAQKMINIPLLKEEERMAKELFDYYEASEDTIEFYGEKYYESLKDHPFLKLIV